MNLFIWEEEKDSPSSRTPVWTPAQTNLFDERKTA